MKLKEVKARLIKNSKGEHAIEVIVNKKYSASAPSGSSTGKHEVKAFTKGINFAVDFINKLPHLDNENFEEFEDLEKIDIISHLIGGNATLAMQLAILKAMSKNNIWKFLNSKAKKLPTPLGNVIGGGEHIQGKKVDIQEYLLIPSGKTFKEKAMLNDYVYQKIGRLLNTKKKTLEGAYAPKLTTTEVFDFLHGFLSNKDNTLGKKVSLGVDMAVSSYWGRKFYTYNNFSLETPVKKFTTKDHIRFVNSLIQKYNLKYVEDPMHEEDFKSFSKIKQSTLVCGDDLLTTNVKRLEKAIKMDSVNAIIIKPNQIGSLIKTKKVVDLAHKNGIKTIISHRSGETMDASISHLAVAWKIPYIKCGIFGKERRAKIRELIKIENQIK